MKNGSLFFVMLSCVAFAHAAHAQDAQPAAQHLEFFERKVRPLLVEHCYSCHSTTAKKVQAGLLVDSRDSLLAGGDSGESIVPGDADESLFISAVRYQDYEMPPKGKLSDEDIATLEKWVNIGAPWPKEAKLAPGASGAIEKFDLDSRREEHWVWQPVEKQTVPNVSADKWPHSPIDNFVLSKLESKKLRPATDADPLAIARRLQMDLTGLPPTPDELERFQKELDDDKREAVEALADRLLASPHFGERWGRHWLDLVRYAESRGHEHDNDSPNAFQYRDYVIRALNQDVPYDQFVREQIAGDLLKQPRIHPGKKFNESILGAGFWHLGEWTHSPVDIRKDESDRFDNMIDVMSKSFLGVTVSCARCHDHKFDAISTADFYSLTGFLESSDYRQVRFESIEQNGAVAKQLAAVDSKYQKAVADMLSAEGLKLPSQASYLNDSSIIFDFATMPQSQYLQDGFIFGSQPQRAGLAYLEGGSDSQIRIAAFDSATNDPFWHGLKSMTVGQVENRSKVAKLPKSGRTLRTPTFELKNGTVACLVEGSGHVFACVDSHRMIYGPLHGETIQKIKTGQKWVQLDLTRYVGHRLHLEFVPADDAQLFVRLVTQGLDAAGRSKFQRKLDRLNKQYATYSAAAETILNGSNVERPAPADLETVEGGKRKTTGKAFGLAAKLVQQWQLERQQLGDQVIRKSHLAPSMMDGTSEDGHILIRGNSSKPGRIEPRHFLTAITGDQPMEIRRGSGRLGLARQINDPANPLTSRVIVNRIWHYLMGRGLVPTTDDFGLLGQRPTHPELLDYLATEFDADGKSIKKMIKRIVLSRTYQMSSVPDANALDVDPINLLWHHRPPKRLEGEIIRDSLLALSGELDKTMGGTPVPIHLTAFMDGRGRPAVSGPLDGDGRRSIYIAVRRNFMSPFMLTFDTPVPFSTMGRRNVSNVPAQALILMNDPFVSQQSRKWAKRSLAAADSTGKRIKWLYLTAFGREPTVKELTASSEFVGDQESLDTWAQFSHALVNTKEFIFLR